MTFDKLNIAYVTYTLIKKLGDFPGGLVVMCLTMQGRGFDPW